MVSVLYKKLIRDMWGLLLQIISIMLVVASGVSVLVSSYSTYQTLARAQNTFYHDYRFAHVFASLERAPVSMQDRIKTISGVASIETRIVKEVIVTLPHVHEPIIGRFISIPDRVQSMLNQLHLVVGTWPDASKPNEVLINVGFAEANNITVGDRITALLNGREAVLRVVGTVLSPEYVYAIRGDDLLPDNKHFGVMWMCESALSEAFDMAQAFNDISILLSPNGSISYVRDQLDALFSRYGLLRSYGRDEQISDRFVTNEIKQQRIIAFFIPPIFLVVASFLLALVTGRLVNQQRAQIATLKSLGYDSQTLIMYYIIFVSIIVSLGAMIGIGLGAWFGKLMAIMYVTYFKFPVFDFYFSLEAALIGVVVSFIAGIVGVLRSVKRVLKLPPAIAMRPPVPGRYQPFYLEKSSYFRQCSASVKMVYRYLYRHLLRSILSSFGISLGIAIVVLGLFWQDAIRHLIHTQFLWSKRDNATIQFTKAIQSNSLNDINRLPGVLSSEGYRFSAATLSHKHHQEDTAVVGLPNDARLTVLFDHMNKQLPIPKYGILMSETLAKKLHAKLGDQLEVSLLESNRAHTDMPVMGIVNDYVGGFAYVDLVTLNDLFNQDDLINQVALLIDPNRVNLLYKQLTALPYVSSMTLKQGIIQVFEETFAKHILVFTTILAGFAIVISVSVVYNHAKITLTERLLEFSTLRVLGYTSNEIARLLIYHIIAELLLAIPLGLVLGYAISYTLLALMQTDWFTIPFVISSKTYAISVLVVVISTMITLVFIRRQINALDITAVLKVAD